MSTPTYLDLFCGCGGFSLGMDRAGFRCLAAIDFNPEAITTFRANFPTLSKDRIRQEDLTKFSPADLVKIIGAEKPDVIVGGPPCQGFSTARQRDGANHGAERFVEDERRHLYKEFLRYVEFFKPRVFVMENVLGLQSAAGGHYFTRVQHEARMLGYRVVSEIADAYALGVPQKRRRQLIIGVKADLPGFFPTSIKPAPRARPYTNLGAALGDLPPLRAGTGKECCDYDFARRVKHLEAGDAEHRGFLHDVLEIDRAVSLTSHRARPHSERDLRDFLRIREGENSAAAMRRGVEFEFPYDKNSFKDRYTRQSRFNPCSTIVAHLSKDGLMFIHPTQNRSLTPREAARIQSFPDWFQFPVARTHQFRIIGNAVPPLISEAVGFEIRGFLTASTAKPSARKTEQRPTVTSEALIPKSPRQAAERLQDISRLDRRQLRACDHSVFLRGWFSLFYLFPNLHPDNALDHGDHEDKWIQDSPPLPGLEYLTTDRYARSGWPVALELLGREGWRRYEAGLLKDCDFYCAEAQKRGIGRHTPKALGRA